MVSQVCVSLFTSVLTVQELPRWKYIHFLTDTCCPRSSFVAFQDDTTKHISEKQATQDRDPPEDCNETEHYFLDGNPSW